MKTVFLNVQPAGYGGLTVVIEGPSKVDVHNWGAGARNQAIYRTTQSRLGITKISIQFSDEHIPGS